MDADRCVRCRIDLSGVPSAGRFCPNCGVRLSRSHSPIPTPAVLRGYASAMFRLGFHYEFRHNDDEARRCYGKAERLGGPRR